MQSVSLSSAYQIQRKFLKRSHIGCYKVGASNYSSAEFFGIDGVIVGGIPADNIHSSGVQQDFPIVEVELVVKVKYDDRTESGYQIISEHIGLECPLSEVDNQDGHAFLCIADNCSAGHLLMVGAYIGNHTESMKVFVNDIEVVAGSFGNLRFSIDYIIRSSIAIIREHDLPCEQEFLIATGGLTETFSIKAGDQVEVRFE